MNKPTLILIILIAFSMQFSFAQIQLTPDTIIINTTTTGGTSGGGAAPLTCNNTPQWTKIGSTDDIYKCNPGGKVGIGTTAPGCILDVVTTGSANGIRANSSTYQNSRYLDLATTNVNFIKATNDLYISSTAGTLVFQPAATNKKVHVQGDLYVTSGGKMGIGTTNPQSELAVNGKITAKELKITLIGWSDYVFKEGYELMPLDKLREFINANNHLPDVPSEKEVLENGINVGEMNTILVKKIEELTLYVIELKKELELLKQ
ncbi:MAG TPA: hypothetical protein VNJ29_02920 [Candidatus Nitrosotenuis sp.]|nr:hypothetical protein [Candidatus Nitrosotenuis sp.]